MTELRMIELAKFALRMRIAEADIRIDEMKNAGKSTRLYETRIKNCKKELCELDEREKQIE